MNFKIGDKVRLVRNIGCFAKLNAKDVYTIKAFSANDFYLHFEGVESGYPYSNFEKVEDKIMTKKDMVIGKHYYTQRNGNKYEWEEENTTEYREDLTDKDGYSGYDIMEVYEINPTPIWKREEVKEMTVAEIEKLVGCKVKIVKE